jgi:Mn-dependent DtxR family transcriptional regulator
VSGIGLLNEKPLHASLKQWYAQPGDLAEAMGIRLALAQKMAYSLREAKLVRLTGRRGRANLYAAVA